MPVSIFRGCRARGAGQVDGHANAQWLLQLAGVFADVETLVVGEILRTVTPARKRAQAGVWVRTHDQAERGCVVVPQALVETEFCRRAIVCFMRIADVEQFQGAISEKKAPIGGALTGMSVTAALDQADVDQPLRRGCAGAGENKKMIVLQHGYQAPSKSGKVVRVILLQALA